MNIVWIQAAPISRKIEHNKYINLHPSRKRFSVNRTKLPVFSLDSYSPMERSERNPVIYHYI